MFFYIISPPEENEFFNEHTFNEITNILPVKYFQFRPKHLKLKEREVFIKKFHKPFSKICLKKKIKLIINDDFEIAESFFFDGIHLGQNDRSCLEAKKKFGGNFIVGVSCSASYQLYKNAKSEGADYIAFGPAFDTSSKKKKKINLQKIIQIKDDIKLPFVFIGGINHENIKMLKKFKPNYVAIINSLWNFKAGPIESAYKFKKVLEV